MAITVDRLALLQTALAGRRALPYCDALTVACFDYGISLAQSGMDLPEWLRAWFETGSHVELGWRHRGV
jgi:hypothetical protein